MKTSSKQRVMVWILAAQPATMLFVAVRPAAAELVPEAALTGAPSPSAAPEPAASAAPELSPWKQGPLSVELGHEIMLELTPAYAYLPKDLAAKVLEANGNFHNENLLGIVAGADHSPEWFAVMFFDAEGYIKDDEEIDAEDLLTSLREGNEEANEERKRRGFKPLTLEGWSDPPHYDKAKRHLVWALVVADADGKSVNYNTRSLGRRGYVSINLVTEPQKLAAFKPHAQALLAGTSFKPGARYQDFDEKTDKVAEYGLAGLVAAGAGLTAAKFIKLGLLAKFWKVALVAIISGKKFIIMALLALAAMSRGFFKKKNEPAA